jgi:hypothetical protein
MDNHLEAYYEAVHIYASSLNSEFNSYKKVKSFLSSKLYIGTTY